MFYMKPVATVLPASTRFLALGACITVAGSLLLYRTIFGL